MATLTFKNENELQKLIDSGQVIPCRDQGEQEQPGPNGMYHGKVNIKRSKFKAQNPIFAPLVDGFRGHLDFYSFRGKVVVRSWPRRSTVPPTPSQLEWRKKFKGAQIEYNGLFEIDRLAVHNDIYGGQRMARDLWFQGYLNSSKSLKAFPNCAHIFVMQGQDTKFLLGVSTRDDCYAKIFWSSRADLERANPIGWIPRTWPKGGATFNDRTNFTFSTPHETLSAAGHGSYHSWEIDFTNVHWIPFVFKIYLYDLFDRITFRSGLYAQLTNHYYYLNKIPPPMSVPWEGNNAVTLFNFDAGNFPDLPS